MSRSRRQPGETDHDDDINQQYHEAGADDLHGLMHSQSPGAVFPRNRRSSFLSLGRGGLGPVRAVEYPAPIQATDLNRLVKLRKRPVGCVFGRRVG